MEFDIEQTDQLLSTTRAVRLRLDMERDVPDDLLLRCIELAEQAPTGAGVSSRRWIIVRDPETKSQLADLYRTAIIVDDRSPSPNLATTLTRQDAPDKVVCNVSLSVAGVLPPNTPHDSRRITGPSRFDFVQRRSDSRRVSRCRLHPGSPAYPNAYS